MVQLKDRTMKKAGEMELKEQNKNVSLTTSRINYMDPRITIAFSNRTGLDIKRVFSSAIIVKFPWAMDCGPNYKFWDEEKHNALTNGNISHSSSAQSSSSAMKRPLDGTNDDERDSKRMKD